MYYRNLLQSQESTQTSDQALIPSALSAISTGAGQREKSGSYLLQMSPAKKQVDEPADYSRVVVRDILYRCTTCPWSTEKLQEWQSHLRNHPTSEPLAPDKAEGIKKASNASLKRVRRRKMQAAKTGLMRSKTTKRGALESGTAKPERIEPSKEAPARPTPGSWSVRHANIGAVTN